jgi:hypothetical protein
LQNAPAGFDTSNAGHADVHQDDVRMQLLREYDAIFATVRLADYAHLSSVLQQTPNARTDQRVIVDEQYIYHEFKSASRACVLRQCQRS